MLKVKNKFTHNNKTYYYINEGFLDPYYIIYEKNGLITLEEITSYDEYLRIKNEKLTDEDKDRIIKGTYHKYNQIVNFIIILVIFVLFWVK